MNFSELLNKKFIILDGAMGTVLQSRGLKSGENPEILNITKPDELIDIHKMYVNAGSDIIYANTFGANSYKMKGLSYSVKEVIKAGVKNARTACNENTMVALDIGPIGQLMEPLGTLKFDEAYNIFKEMIIAGKDADVIVIETMSDLLETKAAILAARENCEKPIICTMTFDETGRTFTGCLPEAMAVTLEGLGVAAIGVNCSRGPKDLLPVAEKILKYTNLPVVVKPNAGLPDPVTNKYDLSPQDFARGMEELAKKGVKIFGGCCGTSVEYIKELKNTLDSIEYSEIKKIKKDSNPAICSQSRIVVINQPRIIGERINPTGKKRFKEALQNEDINYIMSQAIEQAEGGADILDVNVGMPGIDEKSIMLKTINALSGITNLPLQLDTTNPEVLEAALRAYPGKAIVNSVNGEEDSLNKILPIVKKYGAAVVALTLDENGIPKKASKRVEIARKIMERACSMGIPKENVFVDCLTLTVSTEQEAAQTTLNALRTVKEELGLRTVLGVSNISFGLPDRELINRTFLTMALNMGLDLPIINPNISSMTGAVRAYKVLSCIDKNSVEYINEYTNKITGKNINEAEQSGVITLQDAIEKGLKDEAKKMAMKALEEVSPMEIVDTMLIPALDEVGNKFESGKIFLPQLLLAAEAAGEAFNEIKKSIKKDEKTQKGKIILATVKGDIHDIGKNIVKVILENYGYEIIDLGKDVEPQLIYDTAIQKNVKLVGLSALMTTTLGAMENTIELFKKNSTECKIMVGGAVVTEDYAMSIGADYYARDAKRSADIAKEVLM